MATNANTKFLVNGTPMTQGEYVELLKKARDSQKAYKSTPSYKAEQEEKMKTDTETKANTEKFIQLAKSLRLNDATISKIGLAIYKQYRKKGE